MSQPTRLGVHVRYPITITRILKQKGDMITNSDTALQYSFKWIKEVGDQVKGDLWKEEQTTIVDWNCPVEGQIKEWRVRVGQVISHDRDCIVVEEACEHPTQLYGMCARCGKDMTEVNYAKEHRDTERASINMIHDQIGLKVSRREAVRVEEELQRRLLSQRKLSLVVDLDQTIIHACIDPTVGEWQRDPTNPNHDVVKDVESFQLNDDGPRGVATGCWYYIKMRPGLREFFEKVSQLYELHVYTMGTRAYAENIAKIVDPDRKLFGHRIISRDENGSMTAKSLERLFPVSTNMVIIIDDRSDVWPYNRPNLIKVVPYDFFKGVGDINSSFLPKRADQLDPRAVKPVKNGQTKPDATNGIKDEAEKLANISDDNPELLKLQLEAQERDLEKQLTERPLLHMQEQLDKEDEEAESLTAEAEAINGEHTTPPHQRHQVLRDDDSELMYLQQHLTTLHSQYYETFDADPNSSEIPDVGEILDELKSQVLRGTSIVLSGFMKRDVKIWSTEIGMQIQSFGAELRQTISDKVTHLVIASHSVGTDKMKKAALIPSIKIVNQNWLEDSISRWQELEEDDYLVPIPERYRNGNASPLLEGRRDLVIDLAAENGSPKNGAAEGELDTGDEDEEELEDPKSPIDTLKEFDWTAADDEFDAFMNDEDSEDDSRDGEDGASDISTKSDDAENEVEEDQPSDEIANGITTAPTSSKRKHDETESNGSGAATSALSKKLRISRTRGQSSLRDVRTPEIVVDEAGSLPTPQVTGDEDEVMLLQASQESVKSTGSTAGDDLDVEDLMAELDAEEAEKG